MNIKIDTKEIFYVISILDSEMTANMSAPLLELITKQQEEEVKSLILQLEKVTVMDEGFASTLIALKDALYKKNKSFVICNLRENIKQNLVEWGILENLNYTPTESEAWDIVQMEEIERELDAGFPE
jgi:anti-anti-sigma regulatory factor